MRYVRGRSKYRQRVYFWWSEASEQRVGFFFPSRKAARAWRDQKFWRYAKYPIAEHFLETVPVTMRERELSWWRSARDNYLDLTLEYGSVEYHGARWREAKRKDKEKINGKLCKKSVEVG